MKNHYNSTWYKLHRLIDWLDRKLWWPGRKRGCCGTRKKTRFWCCDGHNPGE